MPEPRRARPCLPRGLDTALSAVTKWRRRPVASVSRPSRLGVLVLCVGNLGSRLPAARSLGFCRLCPWALASAPEMSLPFLAQPPGFSTPQVALTQASALQVSLLTRLPSPLPYCFPRSFRADAAAVRINPRFYLPQAGRGARPGGGMNKSIYEGFGLNGNLASLGTEPEPCGEWLASALTHSTPVKFIVSGLQT